MVARLQKQPGLRRGRGKGSSGGEDAPVEARVVRDPLRRDGEVCRPRNALRAIQISSYSFLNNGTLLTCMSKN